MRIRPDVRVHFAWLLREEVATKVSLKKGEVYTSAVICEVATEVLAQHLRQADVKKVKKVNWLVKLLVPAHHFPHRFLNQVWRCGGAL